MRIAHSRTAIRLDHFPHQPVAPADLPALLTLFGSVLSLPTNPAQVSIQQISLPFYPHWQLYETHYHNTPQQVRRYVLSNGEHCHCLNYKNDSLYPVSQADADLTADNVVAYIVFFHDACCGRHGFFHVVIDPNELPWQVDMPVSEEFKARISAQLRPIEVVEETDEHFVLDTFMLFQDSLFKVKVTVGRTGKNRGVLELDEKLLVHRDNGELLIYPSATDRTQLPSFTTLDGEPVQLLPGEHLTEQLPMCIDPDYQTPTPTQAKQTLNGRLGWIFDFGNSMLEALLSFFKEEYQPAWGQLLDQTKNLIPRLVAEENIGFDELIPPLQRMKEFLEFVLNDTDFDADDFRYRSIVAAQQEAAEILKKLRTAYEENSPHPS